MAAHGDDCRPARSIALVDVADGTTGGPHGQARHDTEPRNEGFHDIGPDLALGASSMALGPARVASRPGTVNRGAVAIGPQTRLIIMGVRSHHQNLLTPRLFTCY